MKIQFLGTAAAEGIPALFCNCAVCQTARKTKGKNVRTRSQSLINNDLLIDFPADTYHHFLEQNIRGDKIKYLLITHSHSDHFYPTDLHVRGTYYAHDMEEPDLQILCSQSVYELLLPSIEKCAEKVRQGLLPRVIKAYETVTLGEYEITALPANHFHTSIALFYIIRQGEKTFLYAHDTGYFFDEVFDYIEKNHLYFDGASFDCTNCNNPPKATSSHMGLSDVKNIIDRLRSIGALDDRSNLTVNHFSHNGDSALYEDLAPLAADIGCAVSYDGYITEI